VVRKDVMNHRAVAHARTTLEKIRLVREGKSLDGRHKVFGAAYRLLDPNGQSPTVTRSGFRDFIHPSEDRLCTVRELARLQTFPDSYEFKGRRCDTYAKSRYVSQTQHEQLGNAVPPLLARALATSVREQLLDRKHPVDVEDSSNLFEGAFAILDECYPEDRLGHKKNPVDELIFVLISRGAAERRYTPAYEALRRRYRSWRSLRGADPEDVEELLRPAGRAAKRTTEILGCVAAIHQSLGEVSLARLKRWSDSRAYHYLRTMPGVSDYVANCVLGYSLGRDVLPVDAHTLRVSKRLGLVPRGTSILRAPPLLHSTVPPKRRMRFHILCVLHGRRTCQSRQPDCAGCPAHDLCRFAGSDTISNRKE